MIWLLLLGLCGGCGTGNYEDRLEQRFIKIKEAKEKEAARQKKEAELAAKYKDLSPPQDVPGMPVSICMINLEKTAKTAKPEKPSPLCENGKTHGGETVDPRRAEPGKFKLPVPINLTYEGMASPKGVDIKVSAYCYVGVKEFPSGSSIASAAEQLQRDLLSLSGEANSGTERVSDVKTVQLEARDGEMKEWKRIRCEGTQLFYCTNKDKKEDYVAMPSVMEFYLHEEGGFLIAIIGRIPKLAEDYVGGIEALPNLAGLIAGSVKVKH